MIILPAKHDWPARLMLMAVLKRRRLNPELITKEGFPELLELAAKDVKCAQSAERRRVIDAARLRADPNPVDHSAGRRSRSNYEFITNRNR